MVILLFIASVILFIFLDINDSLHHIELKYPGFNKRKLLYTDFETICQTENITTWQDKIPWEGWYFKKNSYNFIIINRSLPDGNKLFTAFHELGHYFTHVGKQNGNGGRPGWWRQKKMELQADIIAAVALAPTSLLEDLESRNRLTGEEIARACNMPPDFGELRLKIFKKIHI